MKYYVTAHQNKKIARLNRKGHGKITALETYKYWRYIEKILPEIDTANKNYKTYIRGSHFIVEEVSGADTERTK